LHDILFFHFQFYSFLISLIFSIFIACLILRHFASFCVILVEHDRLDSRTLGSLSTSCIPTMFILDQGFVALSLGQICRQGRYMDWTTKHTITYLLSISYAYSHKYAFMHTNTHTHKHTNTHTHTHLSYCKSCEYNIFYLYFSLCLCFCLSLERLMHREKI